MQDSEQKAESVLEVAGDMVLEVNHEGFIESANARSAQMTGYAPSDLLHKEITFLVTENVLLLKMQQLKEEYFLFLSVFFSLHW